LITLETACGRHQIPSLICSVLRPSFKVSGLNPNEVKDVVQNMPGGMQLMPNHRALFPTYYTTTAIQAATRPAASGPGFDGNGAASGVLS